MSGPAGRGFYSAVPDGWTTIAGAASTLGITESAVRKQRHRIRGAVKKPLYGTTEAWLLPLESLAEVWPNRINATGPEVEVVVDHSAEIDALKDHIETLQKQVASDGATISDLRETLRVTRLQLPAAPEQPATEPEREDTSVEQPAAKQLGLFARALNFRR